MPLPVAVPAAAPTRMGAEERAAVDAAIASVVDEGPWIGGPAVATFEADFARFVGADDVIGVANGTDALALAFVALQLPPGSGVLIAANEGGYAASAARQVGLVPFPMDVDERTLAPSAETARAADDASVSAIVITHLHGDAVGLNQLDVWRRERGLRLVEDCAQATGLRIDGRHVGLTGDASAFSFYPTKNLGGLGDSGALVVADGAERARARSLAQYGWGERFQIELPGGRNSRLDPLQAAILSARLPFVEERNRIRRAISARYRRALGDAARVFGDPDTTVAHHCVVIADGIESLVAHLTEHGIQTAHHYPFLLQEMPGLGLQESTQTPHANKLRNQSISLPCFPELTTTEVDTVVAALEEWGHAR